MARGEWVIRKVNREAPERGRRSRGRCESDRSCTTPREVLTTGITHELRYVCVCCAVVSVVEVVGGGA